jgi:hypothetical protein
MRQDILAYLSKNSVTQGKLNIKQVFLIQGQAILERAHWTLKQQLEKQKGERGLDPHIQIQKALITLNIFTFKNGTSPLATHWEHLTRPSQTPQYTGRILTQVFGNCRHLCWLWEEGLLVSFQNMKTSQDGSLCGVQNLHQRLSRLRISKRRYQPKKAGKLITTEPTVRQLVTQAKTLLMAQDKVHTPTMLFLAFLAIINGAQSINLWAFILHLPVLTTVGPEGPFPGFSDNNDSLPSTPFAFMNRTKGGIINVYVTTLHPLCFTKNTIKFPKCIYLTKTNVTFPMGLVETWDISSAISNKNHRQS